MKTMQSRRGVVTRRVVESARLRKTAPLRRNRHVSFPDAYPEGRIMFPSGCRCLDWEGTEWVPYEKDGVRWYKDVFTESDYIALCDALCRQK